MCGFWPAAGLRGFVPAPARFVQRRPCLDMEMLQEMWAIKLMVPTALSDAEAVERFVREVRAAARLKSDHVARIHDVDRLDTGALCIVLELLEGIDMKTPVETTNRPALTGTLPTARPRAEPAAIPSSKPSGKASAEPTATATTKPSATPAADLTATPHPTPSATPVAMGTAATNPAPSPPPVDSAGAPNKGFPPE